MHAAIESHDQQIEVAVVIGVEGQKLTGSMAGDSRRQQRAAIGKMTFLIVVQEDEPGAGCDDQVKPAVVVEVEERRGDHVGTRHVGTSVARESPGAVVVIEGARIQVEEAVVVVVCRGHDRRPRERGERVEAARFEPAIDGHAVPPRARDGKIDPPVIVEITERGAGCAGPVQSDSRGHLAECAVAVVAIEPIRRRRANEEIEVAVVIEIGEHRRGRLGNVDGVGLPEGVVAIVVKQRAPFEVVEMTVVVVVARGGVHRRRLHGRGRIGETQRVQHRLWVVLQQGEPRIEGQDRVPRGCAGRGAQLRHAGLIHRRRFEKCRRARERDARIFGPVCLHARH